MWQFGSALIALPIRHLSRSRARSRQATRPDLARRFEAIVARAEARVAEEEAALGLRRPPPPPRVKPGAGRGPVSSRPAEEVWRLVDHAEAAGALGVSRSTLTHYVGDGLIAPVRHVGQRRRLYRPADIEALHRRLHPESVNPAGAVSDV